MSKEVARARVLIEEHRRCEELQPVSEKLWSSKQAAAIKAKAVKENAAPIASPPAQG